MPRMALTFRNSQNLARQGNNARTGFAPPHPKREEQIASRFLHREHMTGAIAAAVW